MRLALTLAGTDRGRSGIGRYVRAVLPRLVAEVLRGGGSVVVFGTDRDFEVWDDVVQGADRASIPDVGDAPGASAFWHLGLAGHRARRAGADVLLLPAANRRATWRAPVPTVGIVHDLAQLHVPGKYDALRMFYVRHILLAALRTVDELVAVSATTRDDLVRALGPSGERTRVVPNGVDVTLFTPACADDVRVDGARWAAGLSRPYLLYPARLEHPGKNHVRLLRAFARSGVRPTHDLVFVGGDSGGADRVRQEIGQLRLAGDVKLLGYVSDTILAGLVAGADAVLVVGLYEGFGLPALEGLAAGRPVVASCTGAVLESLGTLAVPCDPYDEGSLRAALERAVTDTALRERVALRGPGWAATWSWDRTAKGLLDACFSATYP